MNLGQVGKVRLGVGAVALLAGLLLILAGALGLGQLPGDLAFKGKHVRVVPIATCIVLSIVLTVVLNLIVRR